MKNFRKSRQLFAASFLALCAVAGPAHAAPVITNTNADLTTGPFTFTFQGSAFTFGSTGDIFGPLSISTSGNAAVSSFGGFLGIPSTPSVFFTNSGTVQFGPDVFGRYDSFTSTTPISFSNGNNFLGLRVTSNGQNFYGFAFTTDTRLNAIGFEDAPETTITAAAVPEPATWAMLILGFGLIGGAMRHRRRGTNPAFT